VCKKSHHFRVKALYHENLWRGAHTVPHILNIGTIQDKWQAHTQITYPCIQ